MSDSAIEWTDATWNPTTGCDQVSPGCDNCYALTMAGRLKAMGSPAYQQDGDPRTSGPGFALQMHEDRLDQPLRWTRPRRIFVDSMSDLFHPRVTDEFIADVWAVMSMCEERHTFQILTKRPKRMRMVGLPMFRLMVNAARMRRGVSVLPDSRRDDGTYAWPLPNVWLGTSVEDQQRADERIPPLLDTRAAVRFLSCEPLLGPVDLSLWTRDGACDCGDSPPAAGRHWPTCPSNRLGWMIVGGESGPHARPMHPQWARDLRDQAIDVGVPYFFKQWGAWTPADADHASLWLHRNGETHGLPPVEPFGEDSAGCTPLARRWGHGGRELDGRTWDEFPQEAAHA